MQREWLEAELERGLSIDVIAKRADRSPSTVSYWLKRYELRANGSTKFGPQARLEPAELEELIGAGWTVGQIADRLGRSTDVVRRALAAHDLDTTQAKKRRAARAAFAAGERRAILSCQIHGEVEHVLEGRRSYRCVRCRADGVAEHRRRMKRTLIAEAGGACVLCGYSNCEAALQFHHVEPEHKAFHLSLRGITRSWAEVRAEAAKCVLLCATCHAEVEAGYASLPVTY